MMGTQKSLAKRLTIAPSTKNAIRRKKSAAPPRIRTSEVFARMVEQPGPPGDEQRQSDEQACPDSGNHQRRQETNRNSFGRRAPTAPTPFQFAAIVEDRIKKHEAIHRGDVNPEENEEENQDNTGKNPGQPRENLAPIYRGKASRLLPPLPCDTGKLKFPEGPPPPPLANSPVSKQTTAKRAQRFHRKGAKSCCFVWAIAGLMQSTADKGLDITSPLSALSSSHSEGNPQVCCLRR